MAAPELPQVAAGRIRANSSNRSTLTGGSAPPIGLPAARAHRSPPKGFHFELARSLPAVRKSKQRPLCVFLVRSTLKAALMPSTWRRILAAVRSAPSILANCSTGYWPPPTSCRRPSHPRSAAADGSGLRQSDFCRQPEAGDTRGRQFVPLCHLGAGRMQMNPPVGPPPDH